MRIKIEYSIEQVRDGLEYKGEIKVNANSITYNVVFEHSISDLNEGRIPDPKDLKEVRKRFNFTVKRSEETLILDDSQYSAIAAILLNEIARFHGLDQARDLNGPGLIGKTMRGAGLKNIIPDININIGMRSSKTCDLSVETCRVFTSLGFEL